MHYNIYLLHLQFYQALILATFLLIAYEVFEHVIEIEETVWNRTLDVVVGLISFIPFSILISTWDFFEVFSLGIFLGVPNAGLSYMGWVASQKGKLFEQKVQREYEFLKNKFLEKMKERRENRKEKRAAKLALKQLKKRKQQGLLENR